MSRIGLLLASLLFAAACDTPKSAGPTSAAPAASSSAPQPRPAVLGVAGVEERLAPLRQRTYAVAIEGTLAHVGTEAGVTVFDIARPDAPAAVAHSTLPGSVNNLAVLAPSTLGVALGPAGLAIVDATRAKEGTLVQRNPVPWTPAQRGSCHSVWKAVSPDTQRAIAACGAGGVAEVDLRTPSDPRVTRILAADDYARDVAVLGTEAGVVTVAAAGGRGGLLVIAFGASGPPKLLAQLATEGESRAVEVRGTTAYVAEGAAGLRIVDLSNASAPKVIGSLRPPTTDMIRGIALGPTIAWLCAGDSGLIGVDISEPASPRKVGAFDPERAVNRAAIYAQHILAANDAEGLLVLDASNAGALRVEHPKK